MKKPIDKAGIITLMIAIGNILAWVINIAVGGGSIWGLFLSGGGYVKELGEATFQTIIIRHEWWRLLTCGYLHIGVFHLFFNVYTLLIVGSKAEKYLGHLEIFLLYHLGMVITVFLWCLLFKDGFMVGASCGIFVVLGIYIVLSKTDKSRGDFQLSGRHRNYLIAYVVMGCLLGIGTIVVHLIGFVTGVLFGCLYVRPKYRYSLNKTN